MMYWTLSHLIDLFLWGYGLGVATPFIIVGIWALVSKRDKNK